MIYITSFHLSRAFHFVCFFLFLSPILQSQVERHTVPDSGPYDGPLVLSLPILQMRPPLQTDMPLEVLLAYIYADSLARSVEGWDLVPFLKQLTYTDTLKYALKYFYLMDHYDPVRFFQWEGMENSPNTTIYKTSPGVIRSYLTEHIIQVAPEVERNILGALMESDIIVHVRVLSADEFHPPSAKLAKTAVIVNCEILDTIKGLTVPYCVDDSKPKGLRTNNVFSYRAVEGSCIQFQYRLEWRRLNRGDVYYAWDSTFVDQVGIRWVKPGDEYIVFLSFSGVHGWPYDNNYGYLTPRYNLAHTSVGGMFPIRNGLVYDPGDDFKFGTELSAGQFKEKLRLKIEQILNP